ncbi:amidohydrolase family protein [Niallia sp. XMNu-256]|uniref:amidohydrolase family protein n=1 Tax=Niallia sp. XMNu-256 TaxID=3082444 RepID=UPI0030D42BCF
MIVDCHFHVDETMLTLEKMIEGMDQNHIAKTALIAPMNETMFDVDSTIQHHVQNLFRFLILRVPPMGFSIYDRLVRDGFFHLYGQSYKIFAKPNNSLVARAIDRFPERFLGWAAVNPKIPESMEEVELFLKQPGFIGVKAHPFMHQYSIRALDPVAAMCEAKGIPLLIHLSSERDSYKYLPEQYPKLKVIYAHAGLPFWRKLWKYATNQPNVYVDTSSDYLTPSIVKEAVKVLGYRKVLFGCDGPYGMKQFNQYDYGEKRKWIDSLSIPDYKKEFILGKNFMELIDSS